MKKFIVPVAISKNDFKKLRKKLQVTQVEFANLVNVSKQTIERWETSDTNITGPITTLFHLLNNDSSLAEQLIEPEKKYPLRLKYYFRTQICSIIDVDERSRKVKVFNYQTELLFRAFGSLENPTYDEYEEFLASRCIPKERDKMKIQLKELDIPFYEPMLIIEKTQGRMAEDEFWLEIER
jgi:putative transcriptional regulator